MRFTSPEVELIARVDILEADRDALYEALGATRERADDTLVKVKSDRALLMAVRTSQSEHFTILNKLLDGQRCLSQSSERLEHDVGSLKKRVDLLNERQIELTKDVSGLTQGQARLEDKFTRLEDKFDRLEDKFDRLEQLVRKGFGLESEN